MIQNIDQKTRKELVEIVKIQVDEFQVLHKNAKSLEEALWGMVDLHMADFGCKGMDIPEIDAACEALAKARGEQ